MSTRLLRSLLLLPLGGDAARSGLPVNPAAAWQLEDHLGLRDLAAQVLDLAPELLGVRRHADGLAGQGVDEDPDGRTQGGVSACSGAIVELLERRQRP
jgi:hypothetical protein